MQTKKRIILHADVNNFFASVECMKHPELKNSPVAVTGNPEKRTGIILAKNEVAKSFKVKTGEAIWEAKKKCPNLICLPPHYSDYEIISKKLHDNYLEYSDLVEPLGLDECWIDVTDSSKIFKKTGKEIADELRQKIKNEFGFTISVGVSFSKIFAKLGSDMKKPDATTIIDFETFKEKTYNLPLNSIVGIGHRLEVKFLKMNVTTIQDFVSLPDMFLKELMGKTGIELKQKLLGTYEEKVECYYEISPPKSIGNGTTTIKDITSRDDIIKVLTFLSEKVSLRLSLQNLEGETLSVTVKTNKLKRYSHSIKISSTYSQDSILSNAIFLLDKFWNYNEPIRAVRIKISNLKKVEKYQQITLFDENNKTLTKSIEKIKNKYGNDSIYLASDSSNFINRRNHLEE